MTVCQLQNILSNYKPDMEVQILVSSNGIDPDKTVEIVALHREVVPGGLGIVIEPVEMLRLSVTW